MRTIIYIVLLLFISIQLRAQDTLYREDGTKQIVKIIAVNASVIRYSLPSDPDGRIHVITIEDVKKIVYENGSASVFYKEENSQGAEDVPLKYGDRKIYSPPKEDLRIKDFGRNFVSINALHLLVGNVTFCYEHTYKSGKISLRTPVSIGLGLIDFPETISASAYDFYKYNRNYYRYKIFSAGIDLFKYPNGQGRTRYFYGPSAEFGLYKNYKYISQANDSYYHKEAISYVAVLFQNGFLYQPSKHFNYSINLGVGFFLADSRNYFNDYGTTLVFRGGANIGYKF